ncbi:hypothetical protein JW835_04240 [bacterium]|nr:hypothetical protein [bacterium]
MSVLTKLSSYQGMKNDVPNQMLARELAYNNDTEGIREIAENLWSDDKAVQSDCIKVLYEVGYIKPGLIAGYVNDYIRLLSSRNNRLVWGGMIALSTIADLKAEEIFNNRERIMTAIEKGSVITVDAGIKTLSRVAASGEHTSKILFPYLIGRLKICRPKSVAQYSESIFCAVTDKNKMQFINVLNERKNDLKDSQLRRVNQLLKKMPS